MLKNKNLDAYYFAMISSLMYPALIANTVKDGLAFCSMNFVARLPHRPVSPQGREDPHFPLSFINMLCASCVPDLLLRPFTPSVQLRLHSLLRSSRSEQTPTIERLGRWAADFRILL